MLFIKLLSFLALLGSVAWFIKQWDYEPAIAVITSLVAFISALFVDKRQKQRVSQNQSVSNNGIGIQAGGDVNLGNINAIEKNPDAEQKSNPRRNK